MQFLGDFNRVVVGVTRMRMGLFVIGDFNSLRCTEIWRKVLDKAETMTQPVPYGWIDHVEEEVMSMPAQPSPAA